MLLSYLKIAWRQLMKNKAFSFINIFGLAAGLACCMLIAVYLIHEVSYDRYQKDGGRLYEIATKFNFEGKSTKMPVTPSPMAATLQKEFPGIEMATRLVPMSTFEDKTLLQYRVAGSTPASYYEANGCLVDSTFFRMFTYHFVEGNAASALDHPGTAVLPEDLAHRLFGEKATAVGKMIHVSSTMNGEHDFLVTGVYRPIDAPSHLPGSFFLSMNGGDLEFFNKDHANDFVSNNMFVTYLKLKEGYTPSALEAQMPAFLDKYAGKDMKAIGFTKEQFLVNVRDIHLRSDLQNTISPTASKSYLYILGSIAVFTLLIACINFMNLATARSAKRSSEVGLRKVMGAVRGSLIGQFLGESVMMSVIAFLLAWTFTLWLLPLFGQMVGRTLSLSLPANWSLLIGFLGLAVFAGLLAGLYPAFYLSSFQPAKVLKGKFSNSLAAISMRKGLVVFQFIISVTLIVSTVVINDQMQYMRSMDLGFEKSSQVIVPLRSATGKGLVTTLKNEFRRSGQVVDAGASAFYPGLYNPYDDIVFREGDRPEESKRIRMNDIDYDYLYTLNIKVVAGRLYSPQFPGDTTDRIILNENAVASLGFSSPEKAIGGYVYAHHRKEVQRFEVVGVVKDFHFEDLHMPITPYGFKLAKPGDVSYIVVHAKGKDPAPLLASLAAVWHKLDPNEPFEYSFLDDDFQKNYAAEERLSAMIRYFTVMAILISCLGLFGLASFSAEQRIREIGIRKVLGASVTGIVLLLSKDFIRLVVIAIVIASPLSWLVMHRWLQDFAYRTPLSWTVFLITTISTLAITLVTVSFQAIRAGLANPVKNLKAD